MSLRALYSLTGPSPAVNLMIFDDGIVVRNAGNFVQAVQAFGESLDMGVLPIGLPLIGIAVAAKRHQARRRVKTAKFNDSASAELTASQMKGAVLFRTTDVTEIRFERASRKIVIDETGGIDPSVFVIDLNNPADSEVDVTLAAIFGERYKNGLA